MNRADRLGFKKGLRSRALAWVLLALATACVPEAEQPASMPASASPASGAAIAASVLTNGKVLTVDADFTIAQAIAISDGRVLAVGSNENILSLAGPATRRIDLQGRTVIPGLIDNHMHFVRATRDWYRHVRWDDVTSRAEALEMLAERARALPDQEWVLVIGGFSFAQFGEPDQAFTLAELDAAVPDVPVYIQESYRRGFANSAAMAIAAQRADLDAAAQSAFAARDVDDGEFPGAAMGLITAAIPSVADETWDRSLRAMVADLHSFGLTTVYDVGGNSVLPEHYRAIERVSARGDITMRVFYTLNGQSGVGPSADEIVTALSGTRPNLTDLKFARFGWGEATYGPMRATPWQISDADLRAYQRIALTAAEHGWQLHEHTMREVKAQAMLDVFERVNAERSIADARWTIAHTNGLSAATIARAKALGLLFAVHSSSRLATRAAFLGGANPPPLAELVAADVIWGLGSDATTVASPNPFHNIGWVVSGLSPGGERNMDATVSREAALAAHTRTNAYMLFREDDFGSIEPGKLADLVVLDRDYMSVPADEIKDLRPIMTLVGGEVVFTAL